MASEQDDLVEMEWTFLEAHAHEPGAGSRGDIDGPLERIAIASVDHAVLLAVCLCRDPQGCASRDMLGVGGGR